MRPLQEADLAACAALGTQDPGARLGHVRWCLHTPYAAALVLHVDGALAGVATLTHFGASSRVGALGLSAEARAMGLQACLVEGLLEAARAQGERAVTVQASPEERAAWEALGFVPEQAFHTFSSGLFHEADRDEVALLEPAQALALLHLDRRATGEDRHALLLEHRFAAHAYTEQGTVRGALLPMLGHGLVLADAAEVGLELQRWLLPTQRQLIVPAGNLAATEHLVECGYGISERSLRMVHGAAPGLRPEMIFAWPWGGI
jgi:hypothetical protein